MTDLAPALTMVPPVTVLATPHPDFDFVPTTSIPHPAPIVLDADNLRDAARLRERVAPAAVVLLRIDVSPDAGHCGHAIPFGPDARRLAGLIGDAVRVRLAAGAVIVGAQHAGSDFASAVSDELSRAGFRTRGAVPGWTADDGLLARIV